MQRLPQTGDHYFIEDVALHGASMFHTRVGSFQEALELARTAGAAAFHFYEEGDPSFGAAFYFSAVTGVEARPQPARRAIAAFMEKVSVHGSGKTMTRTHRQPRYAEYTKLLHVANAADPNNVSTDKGAASGSAVEDP